MAISDNWLEDSNQLRHSVLDIMFIPISSHRYPIVLTIFCLNHLFSGSVTILLAAKYSGIFRRGYRFAVHEIATRYFYKIIVFAPQVAKLSRDTYIRYRLWLDLNIISSFGAIQVI